MSSAERLPVVFLAHAYPRFAGDPVGSFIHTLAVALRDEGIDVSVVAPAADGVPARDVLDGIPIRRFRYAPRRWETLAYTGTMSAQVAGSWPGRIAMLGFLAAALVATARERRATGATILHAHWWFPAGLVARALRAVTRTPYVITLHGSDLRLALGSAWGRRLFRAVARRASRITAVSAWLARGAEEIAPGLDVPVAPMPVSVALFERASAPRDARRLLFVGKLSPQKGLDRLLRAMSLMHEPCTLTVVGAGRVDDEAVRMRASALGLGDRIEWLPLLSQAELAEQYRRAAVHVIPALEEGLGLTAVEAQLSETPVVAFASGGMPDLIMDGVTGVLVGAGDEPALASALDRALASDAQRVALGLAGRAAALERFSPRAVASGYGALYREATKQR